MIISYIIISLLIMVGVIVEFDIDERRKTSITHVALALIFSFALVPLIIGCMIGIICKKTIKDNVWFIENKFWTIY